MVLPCSMEVRFIYFSTHICVPTLCSVNGKFIPFIKNQDVFVLNILGAEISRLSFPYVWGTKFGPLKIFVYFEIILGKHCKTGTEFLYIIPQASPYIGRLHSPGTMIKIRKWIRARRRSLKARHPFGFHGFLRWCRFSVADRVPDSTRAWAMTS